MQDLKLALERARREAASFSDGRLASVEFRDRHEPNRDAKRTTRKVECHPEVWRRNLVLGRNEADGHWQSYRTLRTQVLQRLDDKRQRLLGITSPLADAGKTLTAVNLAISLARTAGRSVLLVDLDLRRPSVHRLFGYEPELGLEDYFQGRASLPDVLINPGAGALTLLPIRGPVDNSSELLASAEMAELVMEMRNRYPNRIIVFDLPPVLVSDDVLAFSPLMEACLLVLEAGRSRKDEILRSIELLHRTSLVGTVLNKAQEREVAYY